MKWEEKKKIILLNRDTKYYTEEFKEFVLANAESFDTQAWHMFIMSVSLIKEHIEDNKEFWQKMVPHMKNFDYFNLDFSGGLRFEIALRNLGEEVE